MHHRAQEVQRLRPHERDVVVWQPRLAVRLVFLLLHELLGHVVHLRHKAHAHAPKRLRHHDAFDAFLVVRRPGSVAREQRIHKHVREKQRPLTLDVIKHAELVRLVVQPARVLKHRLVAVPEEALAAILSLQLGDNVRVRGVNELAAPQGEGGEADHAEQGGVHLLAVGLARCERLQRVFIAGQLVGQHMDDRVRPTHGAKEVHAPHGAEGRHSHTHAGRVQLGRAQVALVSAFPDAKVRRAVCALDVEHKVLHKGHLVLSVHDAQAREGHLGKKEHEDARGVHLQVAPLVVRHHRFPCLGVVFGMQRILGCLGVLENLHLGRLPHHGAQQAAHQLHHGHFQLKGTHAGLHCLVLTFLVGQGQRPHTQDAVHVVPHPCVRVVPVHGDRGAGGQEAGARVLLVQHHALHDAMEVVQGAGGGGEVRRLVHLSGQRRSRGGVHG
mmetsp:Transcript_45670/g.114921  ORF Transcript_45670/g.114921 Transcript_45670/m.114921 type:complete len:441 (+) Transcript_45670:2676-3998(+)